MSGEQLIERFRGGQTGVLKEIIRRHHRDVVRYCWFILGHAKQGRAAAAATFLKLADSANSYRDNTDLAEWLIEIAQEVCDEMSSLNWLARRQRIAGLRSVVDSSMIAVADRKSRHVIFSSRRKMSPNQLRAAAMWLFAGLTIPQVARLLNQDQPATASLVLGALHYLDRSLTGVPTRET